MTHSQESLPFRRLIPSTSMLLAFEAAARLKSFTQAATELHQTQGAVSRQVAALERQLGVTLFERQHKTLYLTDIGKRYASDIRPALDRIRHASLAAIANPDGGALNLAILPTFGTRWLIPKMSGFLARHSHITVNFVTKFSPFDFREENLHAAIHYGDDDWSGAQATLLMHEQCVPVCSPSYIEKYPMETACAIAKQPLLHLTSRPKAWGRWLQHRGVETPIESAMSFEEISILTQAAVNHLGVALLPTFLIEPELTSQQLVVIDSTPTPSHLAYYLVVPSDYTNYTPVQVFKKWLLEMVQ